jgi:hypothetical protein
MKFLENNDNFNKILVIALLVMTVGNFLTLFYLYILSIFLFNDIKYINALNLFFSAV